jgi:hypothetical protein
MLENLVVADGNVMSSSSLRLIKEKAYRRALRLGQDDSRAGPADQPPRPRLRLSQIRSMLFEKCDHVDDVIVFS